MRVSMPMTKLILIGVALALAAPSLAERDSVRQERAERAARQAELDRVCEQQRAPHVQAEYARQMALCLQRRGAQHQADCDRYMSSFYAPGAPGAQKFYDLPACVAAFEFERGDARRR